MCPENLEAAEHGASGELTEGAVVGVRVSESAGGGGNYGKEGWRNEWGVSFQPWKCICSWTWALLGGLSRVLRAVVSGPGGALPPREQASMSGDMFSCHT